MAATIAHLTMSGGKNPKGKQEMNEPLQRFGEAKKWMAGIYDELNEYVNELYAFYLSLNDNEQKFVPTQQVCEVKRFRDSIKTIREMVDRDKMKVVFFGRTSNGKSTVINTMLHSKILPQGIGHTTCCFLQIEGGLEKEKHFVKEGDASQRPIHELDSVGHALGSADSTLGKDSLIRIFYPKSASKLLQSDVVIVDSPGVDLSPEFDSWIDKHCLDADVFVLVCNSEATLTQAEKNFFIRVSKKLSQPNIFILCNRWDASASESKEVCAQIRHQHEQRFDHFLVNELQVCSAQQAKNRYFFISAREMLDSRLREKGEPMRTIPYQLEGHERRAMEFRLFEEQFEKCISKSAIHTKFYAHNRRAREIIDAIQDNLDTLVNAATQEKKRLALDYQLKTKEFAECRENFKVFERNYLGERQQLCVEVHMKVSTDFIEEISRLEAIIDRFKCEQPFSAEDPMFIANYKKELANHVNDVLTDELQNQCTGGLMEQIWSLERRMHAHVRKVLNEKHANELDKILKYKQLFKFVITVNCPQLVEDFHEDLEFRFSLGIENIARWILSVTRGQPITSIDKNILRLNSPSNTTARIAGQPNQHEVDAFLSNIILQSAGYLVNGSVGLTIAGLVIYKNIDWRWIVAGAGALAGFYMFERLRWDNSAKEERFKCQFRQHLEQRLHQAENIQTSQCEQQVIQELGQYYEGLHTIVGGFHREMKESIDDTNKGINRVDTTLSGIAKIKNKFRFMGKNLESFGTRFLGADSP